MQNITLPEKIVITISILIIIIFSAAGFFLYNHLQPAQAQNELSTQAVIESVSKIAELPQEQPTIATVTDKEKLMHFSFFSQAQLGDKVLIFNDAKKAYLYRPATNKIVEVGPIMISEVEESPVPVLAESEIIETAEIVTEASVAAVQTEPATISLLNGTKGKGVAAKAEKELEGDKLLNIEVKTKGNSKNDYEKTQIYYVNKDYQNTAQQIAQLLNAEIVELPKGELTPKTDIVVFLGTDRL